MGVTLEFSINTLKNERAKKAYIIEECDSRLAKAEFSNQWEQLKDDRKKGYGTMGRL